MFMSVALAQTQMGKHWAVKMEEHNISARKLMASHPVLFLRNLPLLASCLRGRTQYEFSMFRAGNHLTLFTIMLGLLELARPHIFLSGHTPHLEDALGCYMDMIDAYLYKWDSFKWIIERSAMIVSQYHLRTNFFIFRCIQFLISWQDAGGSAAVSAASFMRKYSGILLRLCSNQSVIHRIDSVKTLMSTVTLHGGQGDSGGGVSKDSQVKMSKFTNIHDSLDHDAGRLLAELTASADSSDRLLAVLNDIQSFSNPKPGILIHFQVVMILVSSISILKYYNV